MVDAGYDSGRRAVGQGEFPSWADLHPAQRHHDDQTPEEQTASLHYPHHLWTSVTLTLIIHQTLGAENIPKSALLSYTTTWCSLPTPSCVRGRGGGEGRRERGEEEGELETMAIQPYRMVVPSPHALQTVLGREACVGETSPCLKPHQCQRTWLR